MSNDKTPSGDLSGEALRQAREAHQQRLGDLPPAATASWHPLEPLYTPLDVAPGHGTLPARVGFPGQYPYTRGVYPSMHRGRHWTMRQYAGFSSAKETNKRFRFLLDKGQTGLSVAFDLPTQIGYDSDHQLSAGEVGKVGVPISCRADFAALLEGIPLETVSVSMTINTTAMILLAYAVAVATERGIPAEQLRGTLQNDILKEYAARGTFRYPIHPSVRLVADVIGYCSEHMPLWNPISISGYHIREAGASAPQEVAFTLANACAYVEAATTRGLDVDQFAQRLSFFFAAGLDLPEEVAKFRAARRMWARIMRERFGATQEKSLLLRFHAQTMGSQLTAQQPLNNVVRVSVQALAAALGGCQSLHTNSYDEALALPTAESAKLALRTQQILANEAGVTGSADLLGGSHAIEALTDAIEEKALELMGQIDRLGGSVDAIEAGFMQTAIQESAWRQQQEVDAGERVVVGVNEFRDDEDPEASPAIFRVDDAVADHRAKLLERWRKQRDASEVAETLDALNAAAGSAKASLTPRVIAAVTAGATTGEICDVLSQVFGEHAESEHY